MGTYDTAQICLNGHVTTDSFESSPEFRKKFCQHCGERTITTCQFCNSKIPGKYNVDGIIMGGFSYNPPKFCGECGKPFPWTQSAMENIQLLIEEDENLSEKESADLIEVIPSIVNETPKTPIASVRLKKAMKISGKFTADALRQFIIDFGCELILKQIGF